MNNDRIYLDILKINFFEFIVGSTLREYQRILYYLVVFISTRLKKYLKQKILKNIH